MSTSVVLDDVSTSVVIEGFVKQWCGFVNMSTSDVIGRCVNQSCDKEMCQPVL